MRHFFLAFLVVVLCACVRTDSSQQTVQGKEPTISMPKLPARMASYPAFAPYRPASVAQSNQDIARDFLALGFQLETGEKLPILTRFSLPVRVHLDAKASKQTRQDFRILLARLRAEARIDIQETQQPTAANILIEMVPQKSFWSQVPQASCFVMPNLRSWDSFRHMKADPALDWAKIRERKTAIIFIPNGTSQQEIRDCLHEELAQALGPLNDLYRNPTTVFNDDNFHSILTDFDMLILRAYYDPALKNGMSMAEVAQRLPAILARLHPSGQHIASVPIQESPQNWLNAIEAALGVDGPFSRHLSAAQDAVAIATQEGWQDSRTAFSLFVYARTAIDMYPEESLAALLAAHSLYEDSPKTRLHQAYIEAQMAAFALSLGEPSEALATIDANLPIVRKAQNARLLSSYLMIKSVALKAQGQTKQAISTKQEALSWARYGIMSQKEINALFEEIETLAPKDISS